MRAIRSLTPPSDILSVCRETLCDTESLTEKTQGINRRETGQGPRFDVEWRLPDRSKRRNSFKTEREARVFEAAMASRLDLSSKVRRGYGDIWRLRIEPRFGGWSVGKIDHRSIQKWINELAESGLSPRTLRQSIVEIGRLMLRVHDLRHTYAPLARRAGADLPLLQKTMGHASITVTAHIFADLYDNELDDVASALDALDDRPAHER